MMLPTDSGSPARRIAVIDLGSNTARVVVITCQPGYCYRIEDEIREVVRLREGMTKRGLHDEAVTRGLSTLRLFIRFCQSLKVDEIIATATSAVREAANGPEFVARVEQEIGLSLRVLDGETEAHYGVIGTLNEVALQDCFVLDIGGGSAQVSEVRGRRFHRGQAFTLGALALAELYITSDPIEKDEFRAIEKEIERQLDGVKWVKASKGWPLVGLGGTIRNLARIETARTAYPFGHLHGFSLSRDSLDEIIGLLRRLPLKERRDLPGLQADRADIILPGALVARAVMHRLGVDDLIVSHNGLREGLFLEQFWSHLPYPVIPDVRRFSALNLARLYNYQKDHAGHVRRLAGRVFEQLSPLHGYDQAERELLDAAALLHDLGTLIDYEDHHKHSEWLVANRGLPGYTPREQAIIALLVRYHRRGKPRLEPYDSLLGKGDEERVIRLSAILRLAEYLERGRTAAIDDVTARWDDGALHLTLLADEYPHVELWQTQDKAVPLMETAFGRRVELHAQTGPG